MPTAPQTTDELQQALSDNDDRPFGRPRTVEAEELAEAAEQFADPEVLVPALLGLHKAYTYGAEPRKSPVVFARLLTLFDEQPDVFDERLRNTLFWRFKWVAGALRQVPEIPLGSLRQWLTEMRERYAKAGLGLQPYYAQEYFLAAHTGTGAETAYDLWAGRTRTPFSDCEACEIGDHAQHHLDAGDDERALRTWEPVLAGQESCQEEPARSMSYALLPLLRTGRTDEARALHLAGYRGCRRNPSMPGEVGRHLEFCALTGNEARGLELLAENRSLFDEVDSPLSLFDFLTGVEVLLRRVELLGHGDLPAAGYAGRAWTVGALRAEVAGRADDLAARFDARNGTDAHAERRRVRLERQPLLDALELTLRTRSLDDVAPAPAAAVAAASRTPEVPESVAELVARARELDRQGHPEAPGCWARLRTLSAADGYAHPEDEAGPLALLRGDLLADEANRAAEREEFAGAAAAYEQAAAHYDEAGSAGHAVVARACALLATAEIPPQGRGQAAARAKADALAGAHTAMAALQEAAEGLAPYQEARLLRLRGTALGLRLQTTGEEEHAAPVFAAAELLLAYATRHELGAQISAAMMLRASAHAIAGDLPAAVTGTDALLARLEEHGPAWHLPRVLGLRGRLHLGMRDAQAAYTDLTEALRLAAGWPADSADAARFHAALADAAMHLGRPEEALRHLTRSAELDMRRGSRTEGFCTYSNAAQLCLDLGQIEDSIALLDSVLAEPDVTGGQVDDRLVAQLRLTRARALHSGEDLKAATAEFVALAAESAGWDDDPGSHAMIAAETAVLLGEAGEFGPAREAVGQALAAHAKEPRFEQVSGCLRELGRLQAQQQGPEGLAAALDFLADAARVADEARAAGFEPRGRSLESALAYEHGRVNAYAGEYEDALAALEKALALLGEPGPEDDTAAEWAECVRLAATVEGPYLERQAPALSRLDAAATHLTALGHTDAATPLTSLATRIREDR
ncbi:hypothetical protein [Actinacidiphila bryophytorum]|uniref:hypothetical protein n=1 Tax=Actinacidiphila bryophytorum TaxID=1436133 RepID=UPI002176D1F5|nr:hypothetical protein [Actinacidiphila bryophytorum]UWE07755.1 hypothetical protein NYE86_02750 [Actinacidiphila bryophytorum]